MSGKLGKKSMILENKEENTFSFFKFIIFQTNNIFNNAQNPSKINNSDTM